MTHAPIWLLVNAKSGSNSQAALRELHTLLADAGVPVDRQIDFPDDPLPDAAALDAAGIETLAIFTGDGTLNAAIAHLAGWGGAVLVLPGGTMNLLSIRLHDKVPLAEVIDRFADGATVRTRPSMAQCAEGVALAGLLAGPGTAFVGVREAMRDGDIAGFAREATSAIGETTGGAMVRLVDPPRGREEGYPLLEITPGHRGLQIDAFYAEGAGELLQQSWALLKRNFREGPHRSLGLFERFTLANCEGKPLDVLIDGEPAQLPDEAEFTMCECPVDLLASWHGF